MLEIVVGDLGSGKTGFVTLQCLDALRAGLPVWANYNLGWKDDVGKYGKVVKPFPNYRKVGVSELIGFDVAGGFVAGDEIYTWAEARASTARLNRFVTYFGFQSRKLDVDVGMTAQLESSVDLRLVALCNVFVVGSFNTALNRFEYEIILNGNVPVVRKVWYSFDYMMVNSFSYYDTREKISPMGFRELQYELEKFDVDKSNSRIDEVVDLFLGKADSYGLYSEKDVYKFLVDDYLGRNGFPLAMSSQVVARLKTRLRLGDEKYGLLYSNKLKEE